MSKWHLNLSLQMIEGSVLAVGLVLATTALFLLIGRNVLGEGVVALLYLVPIGWSTTRWGQLPGLCAALTAALTFNFFFIPPFYTFEIGSLEGWLIFIIFFVVAAVIVGRIQYGLQRAHDANEKRCSCTSSAPPWPERAHPTPWRAPWLANFSRCCKPR